MSEHTPTPWDFDEGDFTLYKLETTDPIADWAFPPSRGDIEFIVRAVNGHDTLLEAAKAYAKWEAELIDTPEAWTHELPRFTQALYDKWMELQRQRNAAIALAEGKS